MIQMASEGENERVYIHVKNRGFQSNVVKDYGDVTHFSTKKKYKTSSVHISTEPTITRGETLYDYQVENMARKDSPQKLGKHAFVRKPQKRTIPRKKSQYQFHPKFHLPVNQQPITVKREKRPTMEDLTNNIAVMNGPVEIGPYKNNQHVVFDDPHEAAELHRQLRQDDRRFKEEKLRAFQKAVKKRVRDRLKKKREEQRRRKISGETDYNQKISKRLRSKAYGNRVNRENTNKYQKKKKTREKKKTEKENVIRELIEEEKTRKKMIEKAKEVRQEQPETYVHTKPHQTATEKTIVAVNMNVKRRAETLQNTPKDPEESTVSAVSTCRMEYEIPQPRKSMRLVLKEKSKSMNIPLPRFCGCLNTKIHCNNCQFYRHPDSYTEFLRSYIENYLELKRATTKTYM